MKVTLLRDDLLIRLDAAEDTFGETGLVRPDIAKDRPRWGTVVGAGAGRHTKRGFVPVTVDVMDRVLIPFTGGTEMKIGGKVHVVLSERDVLATEAAA